MEIRPQYWGGFYGDSVATKFPILELRTLALPKWKRRNPRKVMALKLNISSLFYDNTNETPMKFIWIVNTHLQNDPTYDENWYQVCLLDQFCDDLVNQSSSKSNKDNFYGLIVCGDFNLPNLSSPISYLQWKMVSCINQSTFPSTKPIVQIDHIFLHKKSLRFCVNGKESFVVENKMASDHRPVLVVLHEILTKT